MKFDQIASKSLICWESPDMTLLDSKSIDIQLNIKFVKGLQKFIRITEVAIFRESEHPFAVTEKLEIDIT